MKWDHTACNAYVALPLQKYISGRAKKTHRAFQMWCSDRGKQISSVFIATALKGEALCSS